MTRASFDVARLKLPALVDRRPAAPGKPFLPFQTEGGELVPGFLPIGGPTPVRQTSSTHGPDGYITTDPGEIQRMLTRMQHKLEAAGERLAFYDHVPEEGAATLILTYGVTARAATEAAERLKRRGTPVSLLTLKTLWPAPAAIIRKAAEGARRVLVVEMNLGQYVQEVERLLPGKRVDFCGQMDGRLISPDTIMEAATNG